MDSKLGGSDMILDRASVEALVFGRRPLDQEPLSSSLLDQLSVVHTAEFFSIMGPSCRHRVRSFAL